MKCECGMTVQEGLPAEKQIKHINSFYHKRKMKESYEKCITCHSCFICKHCVRKKVIEDLLNNHIVVKKQFGKEIWIIKDWRKFKDKWW